MATKKKDSKEKEKEEKKEEKEKEEEKEQEQELDENIASIIEDVEKLSVLELADLVKALEDKFDVSAAPVAVAGGAAAGGNGNGEEAEEKSEYDVVLKDAGDNKIAVIKALREVRKDLGLVDAKKLVEGAPETLVEAAPKEEAEEAKEKLETAGGEVELK